MIGYGHAVRDFKHLCIFDLMSVGATEAHRFRGIIISQAPEDYPGSDLQHESESGLQAGRLFRKLLWLFC